MSLLLIFLKIESFDPRVKIKLWLKTLAKSLFKVSWNLELNALILPVTHDIMVVFLFIDIKDRTHVVKSDLSDHSWDV